MGSNGAPEEIRTPDPQIRSLVLYPAELRVRAAEAVLLAWRSSKTSYLRMQAILFLNRHFPAMNFTDH